MTRETWIPPFRDLDGREFHLRPNGRLYEVIEVEGVGIDIPLPEGEDVEAIMHAAGLTLDKKNP